jgi:hypothetical protein
MSKCYVRSRKEAMLMANMFEEFFQAHVDVVEEALDDTIDTVVDELTGNHDDDED